MKIKIIYIFAIIICLLIQYQPANAKTGKWEIVDIKPDYNADTTFSYTWSLKCADSANCMSWGYYEGCGGYYFRRTTDGGKNWKTVYQDSAYLHSFQDMHFVPDITDIAYPNTKLFIAVGDSGLIVRSTDKGDTWQQFRLDTNLKLESIRMLDDNYGILTGLVHGVFNSTGDRIYETNDGGISWKRCKNTLDTNLGSFQVFNILNRKTLCALIYSRDTVTEPNYKNTKLLWIYNNWQTWDTLSRPPEVHYLKFINENQGWTAGGLKVFDSAGWTSSAQFIYSTGNGGRTWVKQWDTVYNGDGLQDINFYDENFGMASGFQGLMLITTSGGKKWIPELVMDSIKPGDFHELRCIQIVSNSTAFVIFNGDFIMKYTRVGTAVVEEPVSYMNTFSIYPNPTDSYIYINLPSEFLTEKIIIYSVEGIEVYQEPSEGLKPMEGYKIDVSRFAAGVYYVKVGDRVCRFIKI